MLIIVAGLFKPLGRAVAAIPAPLANAMLAGVLIGLCFAPVKAIAFNPLFGLPIVVAWFVVGAINRLCAVPAALAGIRAGARLRRRYPGRRAGRCRRRSCRRRIGRPVFTWPASSVIALPLFIVTMASQNIPGIAVLRVNGYEPTAGPLFAATGIFSLLAAPFGGHAVNLAAITAAMCAGEDAHPDPTRRYWAAIVAGVGYIILGLARRRGDGLRGAFAGDPDRGGRRAGADRRLLGLGHGGLQGAGDPRGGGSHIPRHGLRHSFAGVSGAFWGLIAGGDAGAMVLGALSSKYRGRGSEAYCLLTFGPL